MAAPVVQEIQDGERNYVINIVGVATTSTQGATVVDVSTLSSNAAGQACTKVCLDRIQWSTDALIKLDWDATADKTFVIMPPGQDDFDYSYIGGLNNDAGSGVTGDVVLPNPAATANYQITCHFTKKYD